ELAGVDETDPQAAAAAAPLVRAAQEAPALWDRSDGIALQKQADVLVRYLPRGSEAWGWARVQQASSLYVQGANSVALAMLDVVEQDAGELGSMPLAEADWLRGLLLYEAGRHIEAIPHLRAAAERRAYHHADSAASLLMTTLLKVGDQAGAEAAFAHWVQVRRPSPKEAASLLAALDRRNSSSMGGTDAPPHDLR
ncbi:MAG TPA: hypothetical protein VK324_09185, partial [Tepidisphaeraceae bacterium]|nr:hypothetical protein [Tepidisphaeraceae bacterium]